MIVALFLSKTFAIGFDSRILQQTNRGDPSSVTAWLQYYTYRRKKTGVIMRYAVQTGKLHDAGIVAKVTLATRSPFVCGDVPGMSSRRRFYAHLEVTFDG